jgi:hypothetical protein
VSEVERLATLGINARGDADLLKVWLKSRQDGASHRAVLSSDQPGYGSKWHVATAD